MGITNKKELLAALAPWIPAQFGADGSPRIASVFNELEHERAMEINMELIDNLREEFNKHPPIDVTPQDFIRIAARNVDLNTSEELLHFMWQTGIMWETTLNRIKEQKGPPPPPNIGEN
jgi:hypothetical protein